MDISERISRQRVKHIVDSYRLDGDEPDAFQAYLEDLLETFAHPLIELALIDVLAKAWKEIPMQKGTPFLARAHDCLKDWQSKPISTAVTAAKFEQITGLDSSRIFDEEGNVKVKPRSSQGATESL